MFIVLTLGLVVLTHLMQIAVAMMAVAAVWGLALLATRPRATSTATSAAATTSVAPATASTSMAPTASTSLGIPAQTIEREPARPAGSLARQL